MIMFSDEVFSVLKLVVFLNILCKTDFIYYYYNFFFFFYCFSQRKGKFTEAPGPQAGGCPVGKETGRGALFDVLPGVQVVGVATLLAAVDRRGYR